VAAKPKLFVGSSSEGKGLAQELCTRVASHAIAIGWWDSPEFLNGYSSLDALLKATETYDFAAFLLTADDKRTSRRVAGRVPRDNVVFEYGLFLGRLRQGRVVAFVQDGTKLPSDVAGIQMERFTMPGDEHERVATASQLAAIVGKAIDRTPAWWDLHLGDVIGGWSILPQKPFFSVTLTKEGLNVRSATFMGRQLLLVIRRQDDSIAPMNDTRIGVSELRRHGVLDENVRIVAAGPSIIGKAPDKTVIEGRVFVVPEAFQTPKTIEDIIAQGGRLVGTVTRTIRRGSAE
jgi:hypothetical protein